MAIKQEPIQRSVGLTQQNVSAGSGLNQLSEATQAVSNLVTGKLNEIAINEASELGSRDVEQGKAPEALAPGFTKATKAYNNAVVEAESRNQLISASELIVSSLESNKQPSKFNTNSPVVLAAEMKGIKEGTLEHARPESRAHLTEKLDLMIHGATEDMAKHAINQDNNRIKTDFTKELDRQVEAKKNAHTVGDAAATADARQEIINILDNYSELSVEIKENRKEIEESLQKTEDVHQVLGDFAQSIEDGTTTKFKTDLANNKGKLPDDVWRRAVDEVGKLDKAHQNLLIDINGEELALVKDGIQNGTIKSREQIDSFKNLTFEQRTTQTTNLHRQQLAAQTEAQKVINAKVNIASGRSSFIPSETKDKMLVAVVEEIDKDKRAEAAQNGTVAQAADIGDIAESILGRGNHPMSGMPGLAMGTDVTKFNNQLSTMLTKGTAFEVEQAGLVYQSMTEVDDGYKNVNITSDALTVAKQFVSNNRGSTPPAEAAQLAIDATRNTTDAQFQERNRFFQNNYNATNFGTKVNNVDKLYHKQFGVWPAAETNKNAIGVFRDTFFAHWMRSGDEGVAVAATMDHMRTWGTDPHWPPGVVDDGAPSKEFTTLTKTGYAFDNQMVTNLQSFMDSNEASRKLVPGLQKVEWADPKQTLPRDITEEDKLWTKLTLGSRPRIVVDGHESDVFLARTAMSNLGKKNYSYAYLDKFGSVTLLTDATNTRNGLSTFAPDSLAEWVPRLTTEQKESAEQTQAEKTYYAKKDEENYMPRIFRGAQALGKLIKGDDRDPFERLIGNLEAEVVKKKEIKKIKEGLFKKDNVQAASSSSADNAALNPTLPNPEDAK